MSLGAEAYTNLLNTAKHHHPRIASFVRSKGRLAIRDSGSDCLVRFLAHTVVGQQLSTAVAQTIWKKIETLCGVLERPLAEVLAPRFEVQIRQCGVSQGKVRAMIGMSRAYSEGVLCENQLKGSDYDSIRETITSLLGFGPWSADMVAMFFVQLPDVWPETDAALRRGLKHLAPGEEPREVASLYSPYRTYLARYVWAAVDAGLATD